MQGYQVFKALIDLGVKDEGFEWIDEYDDFTLLCSVILAQNARWPQALAALKALDEARVHTPQILVSTPLKTLEALIKPSGYYKMKAARLQGLMNRLLQDFSSLDDFKENVSEDWLLGIKGIGPESCDSILNYLCGREVLVVDAYSARLLAQLGYCFENYYDLREFLMSGIAAKQDELNTLLKDNLSLAKLYAHFHSLIINYSKNNIKKGILEAKAKENLEKILGF